jgi:hypothetical protein
MIKYNDAHCSEILIYGKMFTYWRAKMSFMRRSLIACIVFFFIVISVSAQEAVDVTDQTIKVGGMKEEELMFGFAAGDKIVFSFEETGKKELKELEILEYPTSSKFSDYKTSKTEKTILVNKDGVYVFRFKNSALSGRICRIHIQRISASETTRNFNTAVTWIEQQDTTWNIYTKDVIIGYDTTYIYGKRKNLVSLDTIVVPLFDKQIRVNSETALGKSQYAYATVNLPQNTYKPNLFNPYESTEVLAWSYWLGTGQQAKEDYDRANQKLSSGIRTLGNLTGYGVLANLAATGLSLISNSALGDNVQYQFSCTMNNQLVTLDYGNVVSASGRNEKVKQGSFTVELFNDNFREGIDVNLKMVALQLHKVWKDEDYREQKIIARTEKQIIKEPVIKTKRMPVTGI